MDAYALQDLIGKKVVAWESDPSHEFIVLRFDDGDAQTLYVEGDCCSHSWIEHLTGVRDFEPAVLTDIKDGGVVGEDCSGEYLQIYDTEFVFDNGKTVLLEYRNSSNGYYGGHIVKGDGAPKDAKKLEDDF